MSTISEFIMNHIEGMLGYWDNGQVCRFANKAYKEWFGKGAEEMVDKMTMKELLGPIYDLNLPYIQGALQGKTQYFEREIRVPSGEIKHMLATYIPDIIDGKVRGFIAHVSDVTTIKKLEIELKASESKFRAILESAPDAMIIANEKGVIQLINAQVETLFGYKRADLQGKTVESLLPQRYREKYTDMAAAFSLKPAPSDMWAGLDLYALHKNGTEIPVEISISPIRLADGLYASIAVRDITKRKLAELELEKSNNRNKIFIEQAPNSLAMFDKEMRYMAASGKWYKDYNLVDRDIIGKSHYEIFPEITADWKQIHQACLKGEINQCDEAYFERSDGSGQWITWDVRPWYLSEGEVGGLLMYTADITDRKKEALEKSRIEAILDKTNEIARIGTWEVNLASRAVTWSRMTKEIHEVSPDFEPELNAAINFYKEGQSRQLLQDAVTAAIHNGANFDLELELVTAKGNSIWTRAIGQTEFKNGVCKRLYGAFQDINEIKTSKELLNKANEELNTLLNAGYVSIIGTDKSGIVTHFSKGAENLLQYSAEEMIGKRTPEVIHVEKEIIDRSNELSELYGRPVKGFDVFVEVAKQRTYDAKEWTYVRKDRSTFPVQLVVTAIRNVRGEAIGFIGVATDISEIKKAEEEMKSLLQITTDQNKRLKNFAQIVSHNLRSHSGNIDMLLNLFISKNPAIAENQALIHVKNASAELKETIANLNEVVLMNNTLDQNFILVNLRKAIESAVNNVSQFAKEALVTIVNEVDPAIFVKGIAAYTDSILLNFLTNGIKYRSPHRAGKIVLSATQDNSYTILKIADNGMGIDLARYRDKLFGMYKTFHGNNDARGIGLFIAKNQVEAMGGKIELESKVDEGTTFKIYFKK